MGPELDLYIMFTTGFVFCLGVQSMNSTAKKDLKLKIVSRLSLDPIDQNVLKNYFKYILIAY